MAALPHDVTDLYLSPVVLAIDTRIEELSRLDLNGLTFEVGLSSDTPDVSESLREEALIRAIQHFIDRHGWTLSWDARGLRLTHDTHSLVLGIPEAFRDYMTGAAT